MSASLVGSEMCIRDSAEAMSRLCDTGWRPMTNSGESPSEGRDSALTTRSVSYTHLTLPTICSV
eukprot:14044228-Alexandrium_andersonii.AAC.1